MPSTPAPWTLSPFGVPVPFELTFQGWILDTPSTLALTNAVRLNIVP